MFDEDDRVPGLREVAQDPEQMGRGLRIQIGQRLVDDEELRVEHERTRDGHQLALAAGQRRRVPSLEVRGPCLLDDGVDPRGDLGLLDAEVLGTEGELRIDRRTDDLFRRVLEHRAHRPGQVAQLRVGRRAAVDPNGAAQLARVRVRDEPVDGPNERALAAPGRTGDEQDLAPPDRQRDVADRRLRSPSIAKRQTVDGEQRVPGGHRVGLDQAGSIRTARSTLNPRRPATLPWLSA